MSIQVEVNGQDYEYPSNTTLLEISKDFQKDYEDDIILAYMNGKLRELFKHAADHSKISFITTSDDAGNKTYNRGMILVLMKAFYAEIGNENVEQVSVEYSLGNGLYCNYKGKEPFTEQRL